MWCFFRHEIELGIGIGPTGGKALRIGFLAQNAKPALVDFVVNALEDGIKHCRLKNKSCSSDNYGDMYVFYTLSNVKK